MRNSGQTAGQFAPGSIAAIIRFGQIIVKVGERGKWAVKLTYQTIIIIIVKVGKRWYVGETTCLRKTTVFFRGNSNIIEHVITGLFSFVQLNV